MGPRPDGRGKAHLSRTASAHAAASMGPRPDGRGKCAPSAFYRCPAWRQWGRGQTAAESTCGAVRRAGRRRRQWGRGQTAAERCGDVRRGRDGPKSVNGAAARRPRKAFTRSLSEDEWKRQWGRGQTAAESRLLEMRPRRAKTRQWGRGQTAAESCCSFRKFPYASLASMGPRPDGRGKVPRAARVGLVPGVNGAAARRPRKGPHRAGGAPRNHASMGPRPDGRGKFH